MIKNVTNILTQNIGQMEWILKEFAKDAVELEESGKLTINTLEKVEGKTIKALIEIVLSMMGAFLSNVVRQEVNWHCSCGKKMVLTKRNVTNRNIINVWLCAGSKGHGLL